MKNCKTKIILFFAAAIIAMFFSVCPVFASITDGTIDAVYKYAWGENIGWINFGTANGNVHITDSGLSGSALSETVGWINLDNVTNDGEGNLSGYGWGENVGWINFAPTNGGVIINDAGEFTGSAFGENIGWIIFDGDYTVKTDWRPQSTRGGGGLPVVAYSAPSPPVASSGVPAGFSVVINNGAKYVNNQFVTLKLNGGDDAVKMAISNSADFQFSSQESVKKTKSWTLESGDGVKTVYVKFYTQYGQSSSAVSDIIILDTIAPEIKITQVKDFYNETENVILIGETEAGAEVLLHWDEKYGLVYANERGEININLGVMVAGEHQLKLTATDNAGNKGKFFVSNLLVKSMGDSVVVVPQKKPFIEKVIDIVKPIIPESLLSEQEKEIIEEIITIPEEVPVSMGGEWNLLSQKKIGGFVLATLPKEIVRLTEKFPELQKTFEEVGISKFSDVEKIQQSNLSLPGLVASLGLSAEDLALMKSLPLSKLSSEIKNKIPTEIIFAQSGGQQKIDFDIALNVTNQGEIQQKIQVISDTNLVSLMAKQVVFMDTCRSNQGQR